MSDEHDVLILVTRRAYDALRAELAQARAEIEQLGESRNAIMVAANVDMSALRAEISQLTAELAACCQERAAYGDRMNGKIIDPEAEIARMKAERRSIPVDERLPEINIDVAVFNGVRDTAYRTSLVDGFVFIMAGNCIMLPTGCRYLSRRR
jgi:chorismate mutase